MAVSARHDLVPPANSVEDRLRRVIDTIPALVLSARPDGSVDFINLRWLEYTGFKAEELRGWGWRNVIHPDDVERFVEEWRAALAAGESFENEARVRRADGEYRWFRIRKVPLRDKQGNIVQWYGSGHDIEDSKQAEARLRQSEMELQQVVDAIPAHVFVFEPNGRGYFANRQDLEYTGLTLQGVCLQDAYSKILHSEDVETANRLRQRVLSEGLPFEMEARIRSKTGEYRWFLIRVNPLKDEHGRVIRWYGTRTDIEDRKQIEEKIRQDEIELRTIIETVPAFVGTASADGSVDFVSQSWLNYTGLSEEEWLGWGWMTVTHPEDLDSAVTEWKAALAAGKPIVHEQRVRQADGTYRWFLGRNVPLRDRKGNIVKWYGTLTDIEDRKRAEEALRRSEAYLAESQRLTHTASFAYDPGRRKTLYWSEELFRIFGLDPECGIPDRDESYRLVHPDDRDWVSESCLQGFREKAQFSQDYRLLLHDGTVKHLHAIWHPVLDKDGELVEYVGTAADVTQQEHLTQELKRREAYLAEAQKLSHTGSFGWDVTSGDITWSDETFRIFQLDRATEPTLPLILQRIHPEDRTSVQETLDRATRDGTAFDLEHRLLMPDGSIKHVHVVARVVDGGSHKTEFIGAITDITDRKRSEHALRESETRFRTFMEHAAGAVFVHDEQGIIVDANRHACESLGYSLDELVGTTALQFDVDVSWPFLVEIGQRLDAGEVVAFASHHRRKDGTVFPVEIRSRSFVQGGRRLTLDLALDMTDRKRAEEAIRQSEKQLRDVIETMPSIAWTTLPDGSNEFVNRRWQEYTGLSAAEAAESGWKAAVHPKDIDHHREKWRASLAGGEAFENEVRFRRGEDGA